ncbi:hypothetical protein EVAR_28949_1 [Eumeta japonica]|uniref:Uncharacterized protein n=1 Tax=Eumeta variegata TaxID=151549 RepID=A0A4C1W0U7_EUMVA|nr:hypothetical protein EVAR_28949_1 [Eumeta japonica]
MEPTFAGLSTEAGCLTCHLLPTQLLQVTTTLFSFVYFIISKTTCYACVSCVRPLSLFYSDVSADRVEERSLVLRSRSHARLGRNATMSRAFSCVQPAFIDL